MNRQGFIVACAVAVVSLGTGSSAHAAKLYAAGLEANEVYRYDISGPGDAPGPELIITDPSFARPYGVAISPAGELFVSNTPGGGAAGTGSISRLLNPGGVPVANGTIVRAIA